MAPHAISSFASALFACMLSLSAQARPQDQASAPRSASFWRTSTIEDVEAAYQLVRDNHPGVLVESSDGPFLKRLVEAHAVARQRATGVSTYGGYTATLAGFANSLGDRHLRSRPAWVPDRPLWAGIIVAKRGDTWQVIDAGVRQDLLDAVLVSCDGREADALGEESLGVYRADWRIPAQRIRAAPWLFVDEGNPFVKRPSACVFASKGRKIEAMLEYEPIRREQLLARIERASSGGKAGYEIEKLGAGYWIGVQSLDEQMAPVIAKIESQVADLRRADFVVIDLRGNGGGSSSYGRRIANALMGEPHVLSLLGSQASDCASVWRVSDANVKTLARYAKDLGPLRGPEIAQLLNDLLDRARAAQRKGQALTGPLSCPGATPAQLPVKTPSLLQGRLAVVTDYQCFSACLVFAQELRALGAIHLGQATDAATRYTEVRDEWLPSGLSTFSTMQALSPDGAPQIGPFRPDVEFSGDLSDTPALRQWVRSQLGAEGVPSRSGPDSGAG